MTTWWEALILGLIQGLTEWFPVSSSGHLVIFQHFLTVEEPVAFDLLLHIASLLVILIVFFKDILELIKGVLRWDKAYVIYAIQIILASVPIAIVGILFEDAIDAAFSNLLVVGVCLIITSGLLFASQWPKEKSLDITYRSAISIGLAQAIAVFPGLSRSGATNSVGLIQGTKPEQSGKFAFIIAIPALVGASIFKLDELTAITDWDAIIIGVFTTFIVGILALKLFLKLLNAKKIHYFAPYCVVMGLFAIILFFR
jgi:undecaprenyl-diphosphatase